MLLFCSLGELVKERILAKVREVAALTENVFRLDTDQVYFRNDVNRSSHNMHFKFLQNYSKHGWGLGNPFSKKDKT